MVGEAVQFGTEDEYRAWMQEIADAEKREKDFRTQANRCTRLYEAQESDRHPFAILYSNTETMAPAIYNSRPIPIVQRRYKDADPLGRAASEVAVRILKYLIEAEDENYDNFDELIEPAVVEGLVTNRGLVAFKYVPRLEKGADNSEEVKSECVYGELVRYDKFLHGFARSWKKVPWCALEVNMTREEAQENFPDTCNLIEFTKPDTGGTNGQLGPDTKDSFAGVETAKVYQIWDKTTRSVIYVSPNCPGTFLRERTPDPLGLSGFFPWPRPINFFRKITTLTPTPLYVQYEEQARELNKLTVRLRKMIEACKIRGFYNATIGNIDKVLDAEDNELIPLDNLQSMPDGMGIDKMIFLMPLEKIVAAVQALYVQREQCKQVIYEITGVSDILRGASVASETATAQDIKNQWGTLRLKRMQKEAQRFCRDSLRIILEIAVTKFDVDTIRKMTGLPFLLQAEKEGLVAQAQQALASGVQPTPEQQQSFQMITSTPTWEEIMQVLRNDLLRQYKIDIETNSTVDAEATQDKQDIAELMNAVSQFLNGVAPLVENGTMPFDVAKTMLMAVTRRFNFGPQLEEALEKMQPPQAKADPAAEAKAQAEQQKMQAEKQKAQLETQLMQLDLQIEEKKSALRIKEMEIEHQLKLEELAMQREGLALKAQEMRNKAAFSAHQHQMKMQQTAQKEAQDGKSEG